MSIPSPKTCTATSTPSTRRSIRSPRPSCARARRHLQKSTPACGKRRRASRAGASASLGASAAQPDLFLRRLDDGVVAVGVEADEIPRLAHVRRQRRRDVDCSAARMRHDDAPRQEMQAVLHAAGALPGLLSKIFRIPHPGMARKRPVPPALMGAAGYPPLATPPPLA